MTTTKKKLLIAHEDYETIKEYVRKINPATAFDGKNAALLKDELNKATIVKRSDLPADVVRLNSTILIQEANKERLIELKLVVPEKADIKKRWVSVFAPIGTALIGFKQGAKIKWDVPSGNKTFTIVQVLNQTESVTN